MISFGEQLYRLTPRDEETLKLEPFWRTGISVMPASIAESFTIIQPPNDRCLYLHSMIVSAPAEAATSYQQVFLEAEQSSSGVYHPIAVFDPPVAVNSSFDCYLQPEFVLPPFTRNIRARVTRTGTTGSVTWQAWFTGYIIPPGRIARV